MEYSNEQLKFIQGQLINITKSLNAQKGMALILDAAVFATWVSHAQLAGYNVERHSGKMYKDSKNVRTYFEASED